MPGTRRNARSALITPCPPCADPSPIPESRRANARRHSRRGWWGWSSGARYAAAMPALGRTTSSTDTSQAITDAAIRLFHDRGYHGTSIRDIAREANVGIATLFHHHGSKLELLRRIMNAG